jgi:hypothetical protein
MRSVPIALLLAGTALAAAAAADTAVVATGTDPDRDGQTGALPLAAAQQLYVMTDKPLYRPGETVWFRAWELETMRLATRGGAHGVTAQLVDPRGGVAVEKRILAGDDGLIRNDFALPADLAGGRYVVRITSDLGGSEDHPVTVSTYEIPRLKQTLEFPRRGYAAGDDVTATLTVRRATGEAARGARVTGMVVVDGVTVARPDAVVGKSGTVVLRFRLPGAIGAGDGLLTAVVTDGGATESIQRRIPIETGVVALAFFPEGGDLVTGLASRVYVAASSPLGEPVDVRGRIVDDTGAEVGAFATTFRGKGTFALTPAPGRRYQAIVDDPRTGGTPIALPVAADTGCVLSAPSAAQPASPQLDIEVACTSERTVDVVAALRGKELGRATIKAMPRAGVTVPLGGAGQGAVRVTLYDGTRPIAERLVYRRLGDDLAVTLVPDRDGYAPREAVGVTIEARDPAGRPVAGADLAVAVVDDAVLALADDRGARMLAALYLEPEMPGQIIDDPNFYFSRDPKAPAALDLVLGTQGWRRFRAR